MLRGEHQRDAGDETVQREETKPIRKPDFVGLGTPGGALILAAFGIKCAFPFLHNWLQDAYPESTATGTVALSAFTTKLGIYALARGFPGRSR